MKTILFHQHSEPEVLDTIYLLQDAAAAQERLWKNENFGKSILAKE